MAGTCPGAERWLVCEHRTSGERKLHLTNHPAEATLEQLAAAIKARWSCEQAHRQLKEELGLDHYEGRSWGGLHHHALLCRMAFTVLESLRVGGKKGASPHLPARRPARRCPRFVAAALLAQLTRCPPCHRPTTIHMLL